MLHLSLVGNVVEVVLVEDNFLDFLLWQQRWEEICALDVAVVIAHMISSKSFSVSCHLFLQHQKVHDLVEHCKRGCFVCAARVASFCQLVSCLFSVHFEWFNTTSEHVYFFENASQVTFELLLKNFQGLLLLQLFLFQSVQSIESKFEERREESFGWARLITSNWLLQVLQNSLFAEMIDHQEVAFVEAWVQDPRQYWLIIGQKLGVFFGPTAFLLLCTDRWILFLDDLHQGAYVDVRRLGDRQVNESLGINYLHCVLSH